MPGYRLPMKDVRAVVPGVQVSWQRVRVANALAHSGKEWAALLDVNNSGTYNNQYLVRCFPCICNCKHSMQCVQHGR